MMSHYGMPHGVFVTCCDTASVLQSLFACEVITVRRP